ncbi:MAG: glycosyltransferase family 2 protein [Clostridia bacterium]|nr:glycosyltransferase family 2 protein [Clostridia bacterium]
MSFESVSILIVTSNETTALKETVETILSECDSSDISEIMIITGDISTPENLETVRELCKKDCGVNIHNYHQKKPFVGMAFREAIKLAKGSHMITMVSDGEMDVSAVSRMIAKSKEYPDAIVTTSRWIKGGGFDGYSKVKLLCNRIFQEMLRILFRSKLTDITNCYQISPLKVMQSIDFKEEKHPFFLESVLIPMLQGTEIIEIPCMWKRRTDGLDETVLLRCFPYFRTAFRIKKEYKR